MLHLIASFLERNLPRSAHRALLPLAHRIRHRWRRFRGTPLAGVSVVLTNLSGDILLVRHSYGPDVWALPGGGLKPDEDPEECARREIAEEIGVTVAAMKPIGTIDEVISGSPHTAHLFTTVCNTHPAPDQREVTEARFFPPHSLPEPLGETTRRRIEVWRKRGVGT